MRLPGFPETPENGNEKTAADQVKQNEENRHEEDEKKNPKTQVQNIHLLRLLVFADTITPTAGKYKSHEFRP